MSDKSDNPKAPMKITHVSGGSVSSLKPEHYSFGEPISIREGPLSGLSGIFEGEMKESHRASVLIELLGRKTRLVISSDMIGPIDSTMAYYSAAAGPGSVRTLGSNTTITLESGTTHVSEGSPQVRVEKSVGVQWENLSSRGKPAIGPRESRLTPRSKSSWFRTFSFFVPKTIGEPWLGDLHEVRQTMDREGNSQQRIEWATATQLVWLLLHWVYGQFRDFFTFCKNRD